MIIKKCFSKVVGVIDVYVVQSQLTNKLQIVNLLPHEHYDRFRKPLDKLDNMILTLDDHSTCDELCAWRTLNTDINCILNVDIGTMVIKRTKSKVLKNTRSVYIIVLGNQNISVGERTKTELKHFVGNLRKKQKEVFSW